MTSVSINYWTESAKEDWDAAASLLERGKIRHALFFAHLSIEKTLKAHVCWHTKDIAPKTHNLVKLAELAELNPSDDQSAILAEMNSFNMEGRYPEMLLPPPTIEEARNYFIRANEVFEWLQNQL